MHIRSLIASDIEKSYSGKYQINEKDEIIQRIIDRLIFIRRCEDIGINPENLTLKEIQDLTDNKVYPELKKIFSKYNDIYNSGLFAIAKDNDCDKITINGEIIKKLSQYLYESRDGKYIYNFDWIDADILGQVYEQYLGKLLGQTKSGEAKLTNGQKHRKEQGIYYTPTYIVDYIVKNAVGEMLKNKKIKAKEIKVLDPACGSGSFLIKTFDYLYNNISPSKDSKQYRIDSQGKYSIKTEILKNNIYGVDLDNKAVEITKLNLLLKGAEKNRKLPEEIDHHIQHGNSLIDDETIVGLDAFRWDGDFREGSFNVVIGNPPYISNWQLSEANRELVLYLDKKYEEITIGHWDIYILFIKKAIDVLKEDGLLSFIVPSSFAKEKYGKN
jgi:type I restriction-modification system DNA methylase subunit